MSDANAPAGAETSKPRAGAGPSVDVQGIAWTYMFVSVNGLLQLAMLAGLARLLSPADFGVIAAALLLIKAAQVLVQSGYERAAIWMDEVDERAVAGLFWVSVASGFSMMVLAFALAAPAAWALGNAEVADAIRALSPILFLPSLGLISRGLLRRTMRFRLVGAIDTASYAVGFIGVGLPLALAGQGLWSLVAANLVSAAIQGALPFFAARHAVLVRFRLRHISRPLRFGFGVSGLGIIELIDAQATGLFVMHGFGAVALGYYNRAYALIQLPLEQLGSAVSRVSFSTFNRNRGDPTALRASLLSPLRLLTALVAAIALGGGAGARTVIPAVLGPGWEPAIPIFAALCVGTACAVVGSLLAVMNEALGLIRQKTIAQAAITTVLLIALITAGRYSILLASLCFTAARAAFLVAQLGLAASRLGMSAPRLAAHLLPGLATGLLTAASVWLVQQLPGVPALTASIRLILLLLTAGAVATTSILMLLPETRVALVRAGRRLSRFEPS